MRRGKSRRAAAAAFVALALAAVAGCSWFTGEENDVRLSPYIRDLSVGPDSVIYGELITMRFRFDDPQNDIQDLVVRFQNAARSASFDERVPWRTAGDLSRPKSGDLFLSQAGQATYFFSFTSGKSDQPQGDYVVTVQLEDRNRHMSNVLTSNVLLQSF